jgi:hypothetical protein
MAMGFTVQPSTIYISTPFNPNIQIVFYKDIAKTVVADTFDGRDYTNSTIISPLLQYYDEQVTYDSTLGFPRNVYPDTFLNQPSAGVISQQKGIKWVVADGVRVIGKMNNNFGDTILSVISNTFNVIGTRAVATDIQRTSLIGVADSFVGLISLWTYGNTSGNPFMILWDTFTGGGGFSSCTYTFSTRVLAFRLLGKSPSTLNYLRNFTLPVGTLVSGWNHWLFAFDTNHAIGSRITQVTVNRTSITGSVPTTDAGSGAVDTSRGHNTVLGTTTGYQAEYYLNFDTTMDVSVGTNMDKFVTSGLKAVELGATGSGPTGSQPAVYLTLERTDPTSEYVRNRGDGGSFPQTLLVSNRAGTDPFL